MQCSKKGSKRLPQKARLKGFVEELAQKISDTAIMLGGHGAEPLALAFAGVPAGQSMASGAQSGRLHPLLDWKGLAGRIGTRDTSMVSWDGQVQLTQAEDYRGRAQTVAELVLLVKPVDGANASRKRVGVNYASRGRDFYQTSFAEFHGIRPDGLEEWRAPLDGLKRLRGAVAFNAWYQDGTGRTFFANDDGSDYSVEIH